MRLLMASLIGCSFVATAHAKVERPPQFVLLAFDGSKDNKFWKTSRAFAKKHKIKFTYFISGVYFLSQQDRRKYREPSRGRGRSAIGFGGKPSAIAQRLRQLELAIGEGHEIASHANGHFNGSRYSRSQWTSEFNQFESIMANAWSRYGHGREPGWWKSYFRNNIKGFRAPLLGKGGGMWPALRAKGFKYDTSRVNKQGYWPRKVNGIWNFPLANLRIANSRIRTLSMDYNFYYAQSRALRGPARKFGKYERDMYKTYMSYFNYNYSGGGNRAPIDIGHHFSAWNGGAYWKAMKRFAISVCHKPEVICGTYDDLRKFLERNRSKVADFRRGNFDRRRGSSSLVIAAKSQSSRSSSAFVPRPASAAIPVARAQREEATRVALRSGSSGDRAVERRSEPSKGTRAIYDAGLKRPDLDRMSPAERKAYWTKVWYLKNGKTPPKDKVPEDKVLSEEKAPSEKKPEEAAKPRPQEQKVVVAPTVVVKTRNKGDEKTDARSSKVIYDAGLRRPNLSKMTKAERKAYWTKVWYARQAQRRARQRSG